MDTCLIDGDFVQLKDKSLLTVNGLDELLQRCYIALMVKKGSFVYNKSLGSDLYKTSFKKRDEVEKIVINTLNTIGVKSAASINKNTLTVTVKTGFGEGRITIREEDFK